MTPTITYAYALVIVLGQTHFFAGPYRESVAVRVYRVKCVFGTMPPFALGCIDADFTVQVFFDEVRPDL